MNIHVIVQTVLNQHPILLLLYFYAAVATFSLVATELGGIKSETSLYAIWMRVIAPVILAVISAAVLAAIGVLGRPDIIPYGLCFVIVTLFMLIGYFTFNRCKKS